MKTVIAILILIISSQLKAYSQLKLQQSSKSVLGKVDFHSLLNTIPVLQANTEAAYGYACNKTIYCEGESQLEKQYEAYNEIKEFYTKQLQANYAPQVQEFNDTYSDNGYEKLANENDMIKGMGGMDKVMQMTDEEREIAAKKAMASKFSSSKTSSFTEAEIQRMMNDPEYAKQMTAKYNTLTKQEKTAIVNKKIAAGDFDTSKEAQEQRLKDKESKDKAKTINDFMLKTTSRLKEAMETCNLKLSSIKNSPGSHEELDNNYKQLYEKIPLRSDVVQGKYKDPKILKKLNVEYALKHKERATFELSEIQIEHAKLKAVILEVISNYDSFLKTNGTQVNGKIVNLFNGTNTELPLMKVEQNIISSIDILADISKKEDELASKQEQHYQLTISEN